MVSLVDSMPQGRISINCINVQPQRNDNNIVKQQSLLVCMNNKLSGQYLYKLKYFDLL